MQKLKVCILAAALAGAVFAQEFEVASIKPNTSGSNGSRSRSDGGLLTATNLSLKTLVLRAYDIRDYQLEGPDWLGSARFDIAAKFPEGFPRGGDAYRAGYAAMLRKMLEERFKLAVHHEQKSLPVYGLAITKKGIKFKEAVETSSHDSSSNSNSAGTHYTGSCIPMDSFADFLSPHMDFPVLDMTGLKGCYDLKIDFVPDPKDPTTPVTAGVTLREALEEQLGLKLESRKAPVDVIVVDHLEKLPTEN